MTAFSHKKSVSQKWRKNGLKKIRSARNFGKKRFIVLKIPKYLNMVRPFIVGSRIHHDLSNDLLDAYNCFRNSNFLCDFFLKTSDGQTFALHKVMLDACSESNVDGETNELELEGSIDGDALAKVIAWIYTGTLKVENALDLLKVIKIAEVLSIVSLQQECVDQLSDALSGEDFSMCWEYVEDNLNSTSAARACQQFCCAHFSSLSSLFLSLMKVETLAAVLDSDWLNVATEEDVWRAIKSWILGDKASRSVHLAKLLKCVRLGQVGPDVFEEIKQFYLSNLGLTDSNNHQLAVAQRFFNTSSTTGDEVEFQDLIRPRIPSELVVVLMTDGGVKKDSSSFVTYDVSAGLWHRVNGVQLPSNPVTLANVLLRETELVIISRDPFETPRIYALDLNSSRLRELSTLNMVPASTGSPVLIKHKEKLTMCLHNGMVEVYDDQANMWTSKRLVQEDVARRSFLVGASYVSVDDRLFVIGGMNSDLSETSPNIRLVNEEKGTLEVRAQLSQSRVYPSCCRWNDKIVIAGGFFQPFSGSLLSVELFDPKTNEITSLPDLDVFTNDSCLLPVKQDGLLAIEGHQLVNRMVSWSTKVKHIQRYDQQTQRWSSQASLTHEGMVLGMVTVPMSRLSNPCWMETNEEKRRRSYLDLMASSWNDDEDDVATMETDVLAENLIS